MGSKTVARDRLPRLAFGWLEWYRGKIAFCWYDPISQMKRRRSTRSVNVKQATATAAQWAAAHLAGGEDPRRTRHTSIELGEAALEFLAEAQLRLKPRSLEAVRHHLLFWGRIVETLGPNTPLDEIRSKDVVRLQRVLSEPRVDADGKRRRGLSGGSVNKVTGTLNQLLEWAERNELIERRPAWKNLREGPPQNPRRELTPREVRRILAKARRVAQDAERAHIWPFLLLIAGAGLRRSEALGLRWERVDLSNGLIHLSEQKNNTAAPAVLDEWALKRLRPLARERGWVVSYQGRRVNDMRRAWSRVISAARVDPAITPHYFRHTYTTIKFRELGYDAKTFTRHGSDQAFTIYLHAQALARLERRGAA